jgi:hypothetical protein
MNPLQLIKPYLWGGAILIVLGLFLSIFWLRDSLQDAKTEAATEKAAKIQAIQTITKIEADAAKELESRQSYLSKLETAENERTRLEKCIADKSCFATIRVRQPASTCTAAKADNPARAVTASLELDPDSQRAYFDIRDGIEQLEAKYAFCQETLKAWAN